MSPRSLFVACTAVAAVIAAQAPLAAQTPVGTDFSYQGRLTDGGAPAAGDYDLQFTVFDAATGGSQVGSTLTQTSVAVTNGIFTVQLDFGAGIFAGSARWLAIGVRPGGSSAAFTPLSPRQSLTASPYAHYSLVAGNAVMLGGVAASSFAKTGDPVAASTLTGVLPVSSLPGPIAVENGGTGATSAAAARSNLGAQGALSANAPLSLSADTLSVAVGTTAGTAAAGNDARLSDARSPVPGSTNYIQNQTSGAQTGSFNISGTAAAGSFAGDGSALSSLTRIGSTSAACTAALAGNIRYSSGSAVMQYCNGSAWTDLVPQRQQSVSSIASYSCGTAGFTDISGAAISVSSLPHEALISIHIAGGASDSVAANVTFRLVDNTTEIAVAPATWTAGQASPFSFTVPVFSAPSSGSFKLQCKADQSVIGTATIKIVLF